MKGYIQIYTGEGKGKTTAALGLTLRAVGAGKKVLFAQFVKGQKYSEIKAIEQFLPNVTLKQYGLKFFIDKLPSEEDIKSAKAGLAELADNIKSSDYDIIVLDEVNIALYYDLFSVQELIEIVSNKKEETELILTGRYAPQELIEIADLVTEMKEIKHYYQQGVQARVGIEK